jgi:hypothetical protein
MDSIVYCLEDEIKDPEIRKNIYIEMIKVLEGQDWDNICECDNTDPAFQNAVKRLHPDRED